MSHACSEGTKEEELIEHCVQMFGQVKQIGIMNVPTYSIKHQNPVKLICDTRRGFSL